MSDDYLPVHNDHSCLYRESAFVGEHPDEFSLAVTDLCEGSILILGGGIGSGVRSMSALDPERRYVCVDVDARVSEA